jgi:hypothetical protein
VKVRILSPALDEIVQAALWFDAKRSGLGGEYWQAVDATLMRIATSPLEFARSEFATSESDIRFAVVRRFNYVIRFLLDPAQVQVLSVAHASRRPGYWMRRID